jgi:hypothetical protein
MSKKKSDPHIIDPLDPLNGENPRHEVAGCPTGLDPQQAQAPQQDGGGGAPGTGAVNGAPGTGAVNPSVAPSPGEGISEKDIERSEAE